MIVLHDSRLASCAVSHAVERTYSFWAISQIDVKLAFYYEDGFAHERVAPLGLLVRPPTCTG